MMLSNGGFIKTWTIKNRGLQNLKKRLTTFTSQWRRLKALRKSTTQSAILDVARDLFVIPAVTGLRVSDYKSLSSSNIKTFNGIKYLDVKTQKTGKIVHIPLHPFVQDILKKRDG